MPNLINNPKFNASKPVSNDNQPYIFDTAQSNTQKNTSSTQGTQDYVNQIITIYQENFGRAPTKIELDDQLKAVTEGRLTIGAIKTWAETSPSNVKRTGQVSKPQANWGNPIDVDEAIASLPDSIKNSPEFQSLPDDLKKMAGYQYTIQKTNDVEAQKNLEVSLAKAKEQAEPYWKGVLRVAHDTISNSLADITGDYEYKKKKAEANIKEINDTLANDKDFLTLEQQAELAREESKYQQDLDQIKETMASRGLSFSTIKEEAEAQRDEEQQDIVESTKRLYGYKLRNTDITAQNKLATQNTDLAEAERQKASKIKSLGTEAESKLGTENLPTIQGYTPMGNVTGDLYEQKVKDIYERAKTLSSELKLPQLSV